jgi:hypothetical protein
MSVSVADAHAHVQKLVSIVKMATVLGEFITEEQGFYGQMDSMQGLSIKICFLFTVGSVCCVKRFTTGPLKKNTLMADVLLMT